MRIIFSRTEFRAKCVRAVAAGMTYVALPLLIYLLGYAALTYPTIRCFSTDFFHDGGDGCQNYWNYYWVDKCLTRTGQSIWFTTELHYPPGVKLAAQTMNVFNGLLAIPLHRMMTPLETYNTIVVLCFVLGGMAGFIMCKYFTGAYWASLAGGWLFTFSSYHFAHAEGHMQLLAIEWAPIFLICFHRMLNRSSVLFAGSAALALYLVILCDYYYFFYCVLSGFFLGVAYVFRRGGLRSLMHRRMILALTIFLAGAYATSGLMMMRVVKLNRSDPLQGAHEPWTLSTDVLGIVVPNSRWVFGELTKEYWSKLPTPAIESSVNLGVGMLILGLCGIAALWKRNRNDCAVLCFLFLFFWLSSLGPRLQVIGEFHDPPFPMPYTLLLWLFPSLKLSGCPVRMMFMVGLIGSLFAAFGISRLAGNRIGRWMIPVLLATSIFETWPVPTTLDHGVVPDYVQDIKELPGDGVLNLYTPRCHELYHQTIHEKKLSLGYISRCPKSNNDRQEAIFQMLNSGDFATMHANYGVNYIVNGKPLSGPNLKPIRTQEPYIYEITDAK